MYGIACRRMARTLHDRIRSNLMDISYVCANILSRLFLKINDYHENSNEVLCQRKG